jgi:CheY-like chemotaxis protein
LEKKVSDNIKGNNLKILVVDDDLIRRSDIVELIVNVCKIPKENIDEASGSSKAKIAMRNQYYDLLILDVILPKIDLNASANNGLELLHEVSTRASLKKPGSIIGITASKGDISLFSKEFGSYCFKVIEATRNNSTWKEIISKSINYVKSSLVGKSAKEKEILCITVHGIHTLAAWQNQLKKIVMIDTDDVEFMGFEYGVFSLLSFAVPFLRLAVIKKFTSDLDTVLNNAENRRVMIFAHSFGSYIAVKSIENIIKKRKKISIDTLVLCGSVLSNTYSFTKIQQGSNAKIVNECGISDNVLLLSEMLVPNTGMAGRVGFVGFNSTKFVNRYYKGGHSLYFDQNSEFIEKYWLPLFVNDQLIPKIDEREHNLAKVYLLEKPSSLFSKIKEVGYILLASGLLFYSVFDF